MNWYKKVWEEKIPGGSASGKCPSDFDKDLLEEGIETEMEHSTDKDFAIEIAMDHLTESKNYYKELKKMEKKLEEMKE